MNNIPHSSTPWKRIGTTIRDSHGRMILDVLGDNEQAHATAEHIVKCVNDEHAKQQNNGGQ